MRESAAQHTHHPLHLTHARILPSLFPAQYWVTVSKDTNLIIELSVPDARLAAIRHAFSATAQAQQQAIAEEGEDMSMVGDGSGSSYAPISMCDEGPGAINRGLRPCMARRQGGRRYWRDSLQ